LSSAMRSNAGMAKRQGDVDLRFAEKRKSPPPINTLAWLAWTGFLLDYWTLKMGPIGCPETSVRNYNYSLRNNLEERSSHLLRSGSLKLRML